MLPDRNLVRVFSLLPLAIVLTLLCAQTGLSEDLKEEAGNPGVGQHLFIDKGCMRCHSIWESAQKKGPSLASVGMGRNLYELCATIWSHWSKMNEAGGKEAIIVLSPSEIRDIIAYLSYLNYYREPGDQAAGKKLFADRECSSCHALEPIFAEGKPGPPVYEMSDFQGSITLAVALWNHGENMLSSMSKRHIAWPQLKSKDVADLASYLRTQTGNTLDSHMPLSGNPVHGHELFTSRSCAGCHEKGIGPNLASSEGAASLSSLVAGLWNHYPKMVQAMSSKGISHTRMTTEDMKDLMAYVYWVKAYGLAGDAATGQELYQSKQCAACHSQFSGGRALAPPLVGSKTTMSPYGMLAAIWNHGPKMQSSLDERHIVWPALTGDEMRNLIAFFQAQKKK